MSEQELYMISEDRARDEMGATNMLKKHGNMERVVEDYADTIRQLGERSRKFLDEGHPDRCVDDVCMIFASTNDASSYIIDVVVATFWCLFASYTSCKCDFIIVTFVVIIIIIIINAR